MFLGSPHETLQATRALRLAALVLCLLSSTTALSLASSPLLIRRDAATSGAAHTASYCREFSNSGCVACFPQLYLNNGTCLQVDANSLVDNCKYYNAPKNCSLCHQSFYLKNSTSCVFASNLSNCAIPSTTAPVSCLQCSSGYSLVDGLCQSSLENCQSFRDGACVTCKSGYYLNETFACAPVDQAPSIPNCLNAKSGSCSLCAFGYSLDTVKNACVLPAAVESMVDGNCLNQQVNNGRFCSLCRQGYALNSSLLCHPIDNKESCLLYTSQNNNYNFTLSSSQNLNATSLSCQVCASGFQQDTPLGPCNAMSLLGSNSTDPLLAGAGVSLAGLATALLLALFGTG